MTILVLPLEKKGTFAFNSLAFAPVTSTSERHKNASIGGRVARESSRSHWLDGLSHSVCKVFIKASKHTVFNHVYGRVTLPFL